MTQETRDESSNDETPSTEREPAAVTADALESEAPSAPGGESDSHEAVESPDSSDEMSANEAPDDGSAPDDEGSLGEESSETESSEAPVEVAAAAPDVPTNADGEPLEFNWYVLRVQSGREDTCSNALRKKIMLAKMDHLIEEIAVPKQKVTEIKDGKRRVRANKMFPGYIFIHMCLDDDLWYLIRDTSGIGDFVGSHQLPTPMPPAEVKKIMSMMEEKEDEAPEVKIDLSKNDMVKVKEGPFENFDGVVEEVQPAKGLVRVMVTIFGRATPVDLEYWQVEKL